MTLAQTLSLYNFPCVLDLVDIDIDGAEYARIRGDRTSEGLFNSTETVDLLSERAKAVHIGLHDFWFASTHTSGRNCGSAPAANRDIVEQFETRGWRVRHLYPSCSRTNTEFGPVEFGDGVLSLVNEAFSTSRAHAACLHRVGGASRGE